MDTVRALCKKHSIGTVDKVFIDVAGTANLQFVLPIVELYASEFCPDMVVVKALSMQKLLYQCQHGELVKAQADRESPANAPKLSVSEYNRKMAIPELGVVVPGSAATAPSTAPPPPLEPAKGVSARWISKDSNGGSSVRIVMNLNVELSLQILTVSVLAAAGICAYIASRRRS